jgi:hypothetical protein
MRFKLTIEGALIYWIRRCLHDYSNDVCVSMLKQLAGAMAADGKCLIVEQVTTNPPTPLFAYTDIVIIIIRGKERHLENFQQLVQRAGPKAVKHWSAERSAIGVVECMKA